MASSVLGIDIGSYAAKVTVLGGVKGRKADLLGLGLAQLPMEAVLNWEADPAPARTAVSRAIRNLADRFRLSAKYVSTSVSGDGVAVRRINLPAMSEDRVPTALPGVAARYIPFPLSEANLSHYVMRKDPDTGVLTVLMAAARKKVIQNYMEAVAEAGLRPSVIDVDGLALCNAYEFANPGNRDHAVLADIGANKITVVILNNGVPMIVRSESGGGQYLTREIIDRFSLDQAQAEAVKLGAEPAPNPGVAAAAAGRAAANWIASVEWVIDAARRDADGYHPSRIHLSGGGSLLPGLIEEFRKHFNIETQLFNPLLAASFSLKKYDPEYITQVGPQMAVSFGLALRKAEVK